MYNFRETEEKILKFWRENSIFEKLLDQRKEAKRFVFFEGPPTANGLPHIGHFLTRVYKDLYGRYKTMRGLFVLRKAGWDTHGLPVEIEAEKELGFKNKKDIENYGIDKFNKKAKENVWKYKKEWEEMTRKMGFWIDLDDPYITYENSYIETLWYIIKQIWSKKLLYLAHKVVPFCVRCGTPLSSHEVAQGYKTVTDKSVTVKFPISNLQFPNKFQISKNSKLFILAWTTTPWTLPGNAALAVGKDIDYVVVEKNGENLILAKDLIGRVLPQPKTHNLKPIICQSSDLVGLEYEPLFDIPALKSDKSYKIYEADFVSTKEGTGVVHTAVMYGEDDYELGTKIGLPKSHTVDEEGRFSGVNKELDGKYVKDPAAEKLVVRELEIRNLLLKVEDFEHDYPFCWRCDSPLIYYAKNSWFIKMSALRNQLLKNNAKINWIPEHIKEGRFGQWLKEGKDWAFSRERYWGTPLPVWRCQVPNPKLQMDSTGSPSRASRGTNSKFRECGNIKVIGSVAELEKNSANKSKNTYYILRHGYTGRDERGEMIISSDIKLDKYHLTAEGVKQAENNAEKIKNNCKIDLIFSSPFIRTSETAEVVAKLLHVKVHKDDRLREIGHGDCDGKSHNACFVGGDGRKTLDYKPHELGESWNDVRLRINDFMREVESKYSGKSILIVSHGDPLWLLGYAAQGATDREIEGNLERGLYLGIGEFAELKWRQVPRNEHGELDLHRPWIDSINLRCDECGASMKKVPDLIDVWFDSGAMPYAQWHWPFSQQPTTNNQQPTTDGNSKKMFKDQFPADFIVEAIDQTRGWFYTLLAVSTLLGKGSPYRNVMVLGHTLDEKGTKMSKSKGNVMPALPSIEKYGADVLRWYFLSSMPMGESKSVIPKEIEGKFKGFITTLDNCVRFYELYREGYKLQAVSDRQNEKAYSLKPKAYNLLDKWILSRLNGLVIEVTENLDEYDPTTAARLIEKFVIENLSNWWLRRSRKRKEALGLLRFLLLELAKIIAPFMPFVAEDIHMRMHRGQKIGTESVHLHDWPATDNKLIDKKLEEEMEWIRNIVASVLAMRKEKNIKVRQPLAKLTLGKSQTPNYKSQINLKSQIPNELKDLIKEELNVKEVIYDENQTEEVVLDTELNPALIREGYTRELIRQIQDMRKEAKYKLNARVFCQWHSDDKEVVSAISQWAGEIKKEALLKELADGSHDKKKYDVEKEFELAPQKKIWTGVRK